MIGEGQTNIHAEFEKNHTTNKRNLKNYECASTSTVISSKKMFPAQLIILWYRKILYQKILISIDMILTIENMKDNEWQLEDNNSSNLHDMATVQFLDQLNFDNSDIDDNAMNCIE